MDGDLHVSSAGWFVLGFVTCLGIQLAFVSVLFTRGSREKKETAEEKK